MKLLNNIPLCKQVLESFFVVALICRVAERFTDLAVGPRGLSVTVVLRGGRSICLVGLERAILRVVRIKHVTDVAEQSRRRG